MNERHELMWRAVQGYYVEDRTMDRIAMDLGVSRATVSRLLHEARAERMVRILVDPRAHSVPSLEDELAARFAVAAHVVPTRDLSSRAAIERVFATGASILSSLVEPNSIVALAWGTTMAGVVTHLVPVDAPGSEVVLLNGGADPATPGIPDAGAIAQGAARAFGGRAHYFPVPAFFDDPATKVAVWSDLTIQRIVGLQQRATVAAFGVGALQGTLVARTYSSEFFTSRELESLARDGVVGDLCTVMVRADGTWADLEINQRSTGPTPDELRTVPRRLCVAFGPAKVATLKAVLELGLVTDLVVDDGVARAVLGHR